MIDNIRIFFLRSPRGGSILDRVLAVGIKYYQKAFGLESNISHVILQFGDMCYEMTLDGIVSYPFTEELNNNPRILCCWSVDARLLEPTTEKLDFVQSFLDVMTGKKLDVIGSLHYLLDYFICNLMGYEYEDNMLTFIKKPEARVKEDTMFFTLPFTCCSPVILVLHQLAGYEINSKSHLPASLFMDVVLDLVSQGIGDVYFYE